MTQTLPGAGRQEVGRAAGPQFLSAADCNLDEFRALVERSPTLPTTRTPTRVERRCADLRPDPSREAVATDEGRREVQAELVHALMDGPGIVVFKRRLPDTDVIDRATAGIHATASTSRRPAGSPAATISPSPAPTTGSGMRWRSSPCTVRRCSPTTTPTTSSRWSPVAWLGPNYQVTSDLNVVNPGGQAQTAHRDYHLGFMPLETAARFPAHVHRLSPVLTLQGAVAHCDMPVETGPTMYLPHSQKYLPGYLATDLPEFQAYFQATLRAAAAGEGRRGVLQPGAVPRRGHQPLDRRQADGQPAAGVVRVRPGDGARSTGPASAQRAVPDAAGPQGGRRRRDGAAHRSSPLPPRATRSRPTSTSTSRSAASTRRPRPTWSGRHWSPAGTSTPSTTTCTRRPDAGARRWTNEREPPAHRRDRRRHHGCRSRERPCTAWCPARRGRLVADIDPARAAGVAGRLPGSRATGDALALIADDDVDAVLIASHDSTHAELVLAAVRGRQAGAVREAAGANAGRMRRGVSRDGSAAAATSAGLARLHAALRPRLRGR